MAWTLQNLPLIFPNESFLHGHFIKHYSVIHIVFELRNFKICGLSSAEQLMFEHFFLACKLNVSKYSVLIMTQSPTESTQQA